MDGAEGSPEAKARLKVILETLAGTKTITEACAELSMCEAAFFKLRTRHLKEAVQGLEPRKPGPKPRERSDRDERIRELEAEVDRLERELKASSIREMIGVTMPHLFDRKKKR